MFVRLYSGIMGPELKRDVEEGVQKWKRAAVYTYRPSVRIALESDRSI